jgi:hypothetical protein
MEGRAGSAARLIVLDASTIVGAALRPAGIPRQAFDRARGTGRVALSRPVLDEILEVLARPKFVRVISQADRDDIIRALTAAALWFNRARAGQRLPRPGRRQVSRTGTGRACGGPELLRRRPACARPVARRAHRAAC